MNKAKEMSKRQQLRAQRRRAETRSQIITLSLISVGALLVAFVLIYSNAKPAAETAAGAEVAAAKPQSYPQADKTSLGDPDAPVKMEVFEDFQCPACQYYTEEIESLVIQNLVAAGKVYYVFYNFPFSDGAGAGNGGEADQAANAAMCASEQNKFWEMQGTIFANWNGENQGAYTDIRLTAMAEKAGLDMEAFNACFKVNKYKAEIQADYNYGLTLGVHGTPTIFVNGTSLSPGRVPSYEEIAQAVEAASGK